MRIKEKIKNILLWSQKYTKTDMLYVARGGSWLLASQLVNFIANVVLTIALANLLPPQTYGLYRYVLSIVVILAIPCLSGMNSAVLRAASKDENDSFLPALKTKIKWGTLGGLASLLVGLYYFSQGNSTLTFCFLISACFIPLMNPFGLYESFLAGKKRFDLQSLYGIVNQAVSAGLMILVLFLTRNIFLVILAYFVSWTGLYLIFTVITIKKWKLKAQNPDEETLAFGKHLSLLDVLSTINSQIDKVIMWHFLGAGPVAIYSIIMNVPDKIKDLLKTIGSLAFPKLSSRSMEELKKSVPQKTLMLFLLAIPVMLVYILAAPWLYKTFFPKYASFVIYSQVYALIFLTFPRLLFGTSLTAQKQTRSLYIASFILGPTYIVLLLILTPIFGIWGAISAFLAIEAMNFMTNYLQFKRMK
ncbi:MAG: oligosaccharide flippase family protein [Patescibacteria group bacterium]|nr:oligosaccharide flippase family protein [Patescibacteria group bacterium]